MPHHEDTDHSGQEVDGEELKAEADEERRDEHDGDVSEDGDPRIEEGEQQNGHHRQRHQIGAEVGCPHHQGHQSGHHGIERKDKQQLPPSGEVFLGENGKKDIAQRKQSEHQQPFPEHQHDTAGSEPQTIIVLAPVGGQQTGHVAVDDLSLRDDDFARAHNPVGTRKVGGQLFAQTGIKRGVVAQRGGQVSGGLLGVDPLRTEKVLKNGGGKQVGGVTRHEDMGAVDAYHPVGIGGPVGVADNPFGVDIPKDVEDIFTPFFGNRRVLGQVLFERAELRFRHHRIEPEDGLEPLLQGLHLRDVLFGAFVDRYIERCDERLVLPHLAGGEVQVDSGTTRHQQRDEQRQEDQQ